MINLQVIRIFSVTVCGSTEGLKSHMREHGGNFNDKDSYLVCHMCDSAWKDELSLRSNMLSHGYF